jgi:hypothetical protein
MKNTRHAIKKLEDLIEKSLQHESFPVVSNNRISIGRYVVKRTDLGYTVIDIVTKDKIAVTYSIAGAIAIAKKSNKSFNASLVKNILDIDKIIEKNDIDIMFFKNIMLKSKKADKRELAEIRYDVAKCRKETAQHKLEKFIYF